MSYKKIINFGNIAPRNPLAICLNNTIDNKFNGGVLGDTFTGQSANNCQRLLADYCATNWDGFCEVASKNTNQQYPNIVNARSAVYNPYPPLMAGEQLIRNAAFKRFCYYPGTIDKCELFDPVNPMSPKICYPVNPDDSMIYQDPVCQVMDYSTLDNDPLWIKMLENPRACLDILARIYNNAKATGNVDKLMVGNFAEFVKINPDYFR
jgi:hypothetical protein